MHFKAKYFGIEKNQEHFFVVVSFYNLRRAPVLVMSKNWYKKVHTSKFAQGDLNINCRSSNKDKIADVANEFDTAVKKLIFY